jgi:hypothetical protein
MAAPSKTFPSNFVLKVGPTGGLPIGSGTLAEVDLDPKILDSRREI